jgi:hypothetical protein
MQLACLHWKRNTADKHDCSGGGLHGHWLLWFCWLCVLPDGVVFRTMRTTCVVVVVLALYTHLTVLRVLFAPFGCVSAHATSTYTSSQTSATCLFHPHIVISTTLHIYITHTPPIHLAIPLSFSLTPLVYLSLLLFGQTNHPAGNAQTCINLLGLAKASLPNKRSGCWTANACHCTAAASPNTSTRHLQYRAWIWCGQCCVTPTLYSAAQQHTPALQQQQG